MKPDQITRRCKKCGETKAIADFPIYDPKSAARRHECVDCNTARVERWHQEHKEHRLARARVRYLQNPSAVWTPERRARANELAKIRNAEIRDEVLDGYGAICTCCGETERRFLTIDHVNNDGKVRRKEHGISVAFYSWLIKSGFPPEFQVLCMNCNFGKAMNKGICPHVAKEGSTAISSESTVKRPEAPRGRPATSGGP